MKTKLNCVLLIDNHEPTNFFNRKVLENENCADEILAFPDAISALTYLKTIEITHATSPELILLDINLLGLTGWEFVEEFKTLQLNNLNEICLCLLTNSQGADDKNRLKRTPLVNEYIIKPFSKETLQRILKTHFNERF